MTVEESDRKEESLKIRVPKDWKKSLTILAHGESVSALCRNAIAEYLDRHQDEIQAAQDAFETADRQFRAVAQASTKRKRVPGASKQSAAIGQKSSVHNSGYHRRVHA